MKRELVVTANGQDRTVTVDGPRDDKSFHVTIDGQERQVDARQIRPGTWSIVLDGQSFVALNGGPDFTFNEAISFEVDCDTQEEVDTYWSKLSDGGEEGPCGWLKDRFGVSWQIVPRILMELLADPDRDKSQRVMQAMMSMKKIEIEPLERAASAA